jgi:hypothetical protein
LKPINGNDADPGLHRSHHKVMSMPNLHSARAQALRQARERGQLDRADDALKL